MGYMCSGRGFVNFLSRSEDEIFGLEKEKNEERRIERIFFGNKVYSFGGSVG